MIKETDIRNFRSKLRILEREIEKSISGATICCGVSITQCHTLLELGQCGSASVKELADKLELDKSTLSRVIDGLVNIGLLNREINPEDRRFMTVSLTENGQSTVQSINEYNDQYYLNMFKYIPEEKHKNIIESMDLIGQAMVRISKENPKKC